MKKIVVAMLLSMASGTALADDIKPLQGATLQLLPMNGVVHYTVQEDEFLLTATFVEEGGVTPIRFTAVLRDGQRVVVAVPQGAGEAAKEIELVREADKLVMRTPGDKDLALLEVN